MEYIPQQHTTSHIVRFESYGVTAEVRFHPSIFPDDLYGVLPPGWRPAGSNAASVVFGIDDVMTQGQRMHRLKRNGRVIAECENVKDALHFLESRLQLYIAERTEQQVFVHAGAVEYQGKALLLPGRSFAGKTTLVAALLRAGANYLSDEFAVLDRHGRVHGYPRRLAMRDENGLRVQRLTAEDFGSRIAVDPVPVGLAAHIRYKSEGKWRVKETSLGTMALAMMNNTVCARRQPDAWMNVLGLALGSAKCIMGKRGDADDAARRLLALLG